MLQNNMEFSPDELKNILKLELSVHPKIQLVDIYKLLNQAYYGPTHIDPDIGSILTNLELEIINITEITKLTVQDIGCGKGFYRFNLFSIPDNRERFALINKLADSILASRYSALPEYHVWDHLWKTALPVICMFIKPSKTELEKVAGMIRNNDIPRHSDLYRNTYNPHYRVIHHSELVKYPYPSISTRSDT